MQIETLDVEESADLEEWFAPITASERCDWPTDPGWSLEELTALLHQPGVEANVVGVAREGGATIGSFRLRMALRESPELADVEVVVHPAHRGGGIGRSLLGFAEDAARSCGRTTVTGSTGAPVGSIELDRRARFARAAGYEAAYVEERRDLTLPMDRSLLDALESDTSTHAGDYRIVTWTGPCPAEWEAGRVATARTMSVDAPHGTLDLEEEDWDIQRLQDFERTLDAMGRDTFSAAAISSDGELVGFTEIALPRAIRDVAYQFDTIVMPAHRGHRLGMLLKIANLRTLEQRSAETGRVLTWNAASNEPMIRVNELLGFRLVGTGTVWKKLLGSRSALR